MVCNVWNCSVKNKRYKVRVYIYKLVVYMRAITQNDMDVVLTIFKDVDSDYNANSLSKVIGVSSMGALKILKRLEAQGILKSKQMGQAVFYKVNLEDDYARSYVLFLLKKEASESVPRIRRWVRELRGVAGAEIGILFGSVLRKEKFNDVDALMVLRKAQNRILDKSIRDLNKINVKKIHAVKQTRQDLVSNLGKKDRVVLEIIKRGIVLFGYEEIVEVVRDFRS